MGMARFLLLALLMTSTVLVVTAEEETPVDDVDRTDFSDPSLNADLDKVKQATGPHSEVEAASLLVDLVNDKVPVGVSSYLLVSLANLGSKMFNVSAVTGTLSGADGKVLQKFAKQQYGDALGPKEQRSVRFGFEPDEETAPGQYKLEFQIFYNNRDKDQFVETVFSETAELVPKPPSMDAKLLLIQVVGGGALLLVLLMLGLRSMGGKGSKPEKASKGESKGASPSAVAGDQWLAGTLAGTENQSPKKRTKGSQKRS